MDEQLQRRKERALDIVNAAAAAALDYFQDIDALQIDEKGVQDLVSNADRSVETLIRDQLQAAFPGDGVIGEEHGSSQADSPYTWVIDPIDGTANFVRGIPGWCVVLACVKDGETVIGVIRDAIADETFMAVRGHGTTLNNKPVRVSDCTSLTQGSLGVGYSNRAPLQLTINALTEVINAGSVFYRNASGALMLAYVASGRLLGYCEPHMNAWDCMAALLMIEEAGGKMQPFDAEQMLANGEKVVTGAPGIFDALSQLCDRAYA